MSMRVKSGVTPHALVIAAAAFTVGIALGLDVVITSGTDGVHRPGSKHYSGEALDFRRRHWTRAQLHQFVDALRARLGPGYDLVIEPTHLHVEYDPDPPAAARGSGRRRHA